MRHIICSRSLSSLVFATLLRNMLQMRDSLIIWKADHLATEKPALDIDGYTHEYLLAEYERRYGQLSWFHGHTEEMAMLQQELQEVITTEDNIDRLLPLAELILQNNIKELAAVMEKRRITQNAVRLLTAPFVKAGWAA